MLVSHAPGRLLPTIRSRCCHLRLSALAPGTVTSLLRSYRPDLEDAECRTLAGLSDGSIGRALALADGDGLAIQRDLVRILASLPDLDHALAQKFADRFGRRDADAAWRTAVDLTTRSLADLVRFGARGADPAQQGYGPAATESLEKLQNLASLDRWAEVWEKTSRLFAQADSVNLDRKQVMLSALNTMETVARSGLETRP